MYKQEKNVWQKHLDFIILDILCMEISYIAAYIIRHGFAAKFLQEYIRLGFLMILIQFCVVFFTENYKNIVRRDYVEELKKTITMVSIVMIVVFVYLFLLKLSGIFSRAVLLELWGLNIFLTYVMRLCWKAIIRKRMKNEDSLQNMLIITVEKRAEKIIKAITEQPYKGFVIKGILLTDTDNVQEICSIPVIGGRDDAGDILKREVVDEVFIDLPFMSETTRKIRETCEEIGVITHLSLGEFAETGTDVIVENYANQLVLTYSMKFAESRQLFLKRMMDIVGGIAGILITVILTVILAPIIYIQSPGPVFFSQVRVGRNGRKFRIYKFRSMYPDAEQRKKDLMAQNKMQGLMFKMDNDPRIIPIGHFIRKASLDEFPQFWNVLKGDMSLVGTRPPTVDEYEQYELHHKARLAAKPGITGLWQVSGRSDIIDFEEVVQLDKKYISEWSIGMDIKILFQTVKVMFTGKGSV